MAAGVVLTCGVVFAASVTSVSQETNVVPNGSFERPEAPPGSWITYGQGQTFGGWTVGVGDIDHVGTYWQAADGTQSVNVNGNGAGSIYRNVATTPGQRYELRFAMAANGDASPFTTTMRVLWGGAEIATPSFDTTGHSLSDMGYERHVYRVTARQTVTRLEFAGDPDSGVYGPVVDDVTLVETSSTAPTLSKLNAKDPPTYGTDANVGAVKGTVLIAIPSNGARAAQKGVDFVPLEGARQIPVGSFVDTTRGTVALTTAKAKNTASALQTGKFAAGLFQVLQSRKTSAKGLTELRMKGSVAEFGRCDGTSGSARASLTRRQIRRLRARAGGRYRTSGRYSAATVRGTTWTVTDRCDGTLTEVNRGEVAVRDFRRKKTIVLTAGKSYLAKAPGG